MKQCVPILIFACLIAAGTVSATTSTANLDISMTIGGGGGGGACSVSAVGVNFPWVDQSTSTKANGSISITCPLGIAYSIGLDGGLFGTNPPFRFLADAQLDKISYYLSATADDWNVLWGNDDAFGPAVPGVGTGVGQDYTVYGGMNPTVLHSGSYNIGAWSDTVQVLVNY